MQTVTVTKRNGKKEPVNLEKIQNRINKLTYGLDLKHVDPFDIAKKVIGGITNGIQTRELDKLATETSATLAAKHPDYSVLAARLAITALHKDTNKSFSETVQKLYKAKNKKTGQPSPAVSKSFYELVMANAEALDSAIVHDRDFNFDYFGYKVLEKSYLLRINGQIAERPQYMYMRTALQIWGSDIEKAIEYYNLLSLGYYTHATPTLFNSGTNRPQLSSCFLLDMEDSIEGIFKTLSDSAQISKNAGGIGINVSNIRAKGTHIVGTGGESNGLIPFLKIFNETARAVDQGGGKRKGSIAVYIEPWHADIFEFLDLRKNNGKEELRARDLFLAIWMNDLFMERVENDQEWTLMCPAECPLLAESYGETFRAAYETYESEGMGKKTVRAREVWNKILESQVETGTPYILYKDTINERNNQSNIGRIKSSNLCAEIVEATGVTEFGKTIIQDKEKLQSAGLGEFYGKEPIDEIAVCNLASISLPKFVNKNKTFNFSKLEDVAYSATIALNRVIDVNYYPSPKAKFSNLCHRPIGLGVQGLADVFIQMGLPFESEEAQALNNEIFETIYYAAISASCELAKTEGAYLSYEGSPASKGLLQFDLWGVQPKRNWEPLKKKIAKYGLRNSLTTCIMPTASTASIFGNEACCEPIDSLIGVRRVLSGEFITVNRHLVTELCKRGLWNEEVRNKIIQQNGSVQNVPEIPTEIKELYKTVWEIKQKTVVEMAAGRGAFIDQTQSMNIFMEDANFGKLTTMHFYGWGKRPLPKNEHGIPHVPENLPSTQKVMYAPDGSPKYIRDTSAALKTGIYYLRTRPKANAVKFTVSDSTANYTPEEAMACSLDNPEACAVCSA